MERRKLIRQSASNNDDNCNQHLLNSSNVKDVTSPWNKARCALIEQREESIAYQIAPQVDGRIKMVTG